MSECSIGEMQETGPHEITIWHSGMEPQWMIDIIIKNEQIVKRLEELKTHPYNFGERIMDLLGLKVARDDFREPLAILINREIQKILEGKK